MKLIDYLKKEPRARERKNKNRAIGNLMLEKYGIKELTREQCGDLIGEILSMDRQWRKILEDNESLRGKDYNDKDILEQEAQIKLGYTPDYENNCAKLKRL